MRDKLKKILIGMVICFSIACIFNSQNAWSMPLPTVQFGLDDSDEPEKLATSLQIMFLLTILTLAPSFLVMMTSFSRVIIVLSFFFISHDIKVRKNILTYVIFFRYETIAVILIVAV